MGALQASTSYSLRIPSFSSSPPSRSARHLLVVRAQAEPSDKSVEIMRKFSEQYARKSGTYFCVDKGVTSVVIKIHSLSSLLYSLFHYHGKVARAPNLWHSSKAANNYEVLESNPDLFPRSIVYNYPHPTLLGFSLDPGLIQGLAEHKDTLGAPLCPCRHYDDKAAEAGQGFWNCPCVPMRERKECHCMLFLTPENDFAGKEQTITLDEIRETTSNM